MSPDEVGETPEEFQARRLVHEPHSRVVKLASPLEAQGIRVGAQVVHVDRAAGTFTVRNL